MMEEFASYARTERKINQVILLDGEKDGWTHRKINQINPTIGQLWKDVQEDK